MSLDRAILFRLATSERLERAARGTPAGERLAWRAAARYVAGRDAADAVQRARDLDTAGVAASLDLFGELVRDVAVAEQVAADYLALAAQLAELPESTWLSVDLTHLALDADPAGCADRLAAITERLPDGRRLQVGAEDHHRAEAVLTCIETVAGRGSSRPRWPCPTANPPTWPTCGTPTGWRTAARRSPWPPTTACCARRCCWPSAPGRWNNCSACVPTC